MPLTLSRRLLRAAPALLVLTAACDRAETTAPVDPVAGTIVVDASAGWAYLSLAQEAVVTPADPLASTEWDIAFNATNVMLNGGQAGPGGVTGWCVCQNAALSPTDAQILALTAEGELADFTGVTSTAIPALSQFVGDQLTPAVAGWYTGSGASAAAATDRAWLLRLRDETTYAKLRVAAIQSPTAAAPGRVTLEYATQSGTGGTLGAVRTLTVDVPASGTARVDLVGGATTTSATDWDLRFDGWTLRLNGGASGAGKAAAATTTDAWSAITTAWAGTASAYKTDVYAGVFAQKPWYRYNLAGDHRISPTYDVYLLRRGDDVYKVQLAGYYGPAGETRRITVRYEQIAG